MNLNRVLRITLIGDGSSDRALIPIVKWLLDDLYPSLSVSISYADFRQIKDAPPKSDVAGQLRLAKEYYPFDLLIYHRDAETTSASAIEVRESEVISKNESDADLIVCLIPIKMMEAWLLINRPAILKAAGNRNYRGSLDLPNLNRIERIQDPKESLLLLLRQASGLSGRRLKNFQDRKAVHLVAENIQDFSDLRNLSAFIIFESKLKNKIGYPLVNLIE